MISLGFANFVFIDEHGFRGGAFAASV